MNLCFRCPGGIHVTSPGYQHVHLLALGSDCPSIRCRYPPRGHHVRASRLAVVDIDLADDQASHQRSPSRGPVVCCRSLFLVVFRPAFDSRIAYD